MALPPLRCAYSAPRVASHVDSVTPPQSPPYRTPCPPPPSLDAHPESAPASPAASRSAVPLAWNRSVITINPLRPLVEAFANLPTFRDQDSFPGRSRLHRQRRWNMLSLPKASKGAPPMANDRPNWAAQYIREHCEKCPACGSIWSKVVKRCTCGYDFQTQAMPPPSGSHNWLWPKITDLESAAAAGRE